MTQEINSSWAPLYPVCTSNSDIPGIEDSDLEMSYPAAMAKRVSREYALSYLRELRGNTPPHWINRGALLREAFPKLGETGLRWKEESPWLYSPFGLLGTMGCGAARPPQAPEVSAADLKPGQIAEDGTLRLRLDLEGSTEVGRLYFLRQIHLPDVFIEPADIPEDLVLEIGRYQSEILKFLERLKPRHLFLEGLHVDIPSEQHEKLETMFAELLEAARPYLSKKLPAAVREKNTLKLLALIGAGIVYALNHPEVSLHKTLSADEQKLILAWLKDYQAKHPDLDGMKLERDMQYLALEQREAWATRELIRFYQDHPGEVAALIFGGAHSFCDDFVRWNVKPRMYSAWWNIADQVEIKRVPDACK